MASTNLKLLLFASLVLSISFDLAFAQVAPIKLAVEVNPIDQLVVSTSAVFGINDSTNLSERKEYNLIIDMQYSRAFVLQGDSTTSTGVDCSSSLLCTKEAQPENVCTDEQYTVVTLQQCQNIRVPFNVLTVTKKMDTADAIPMRIIQSTNIFIDTYGDKGVLGLAPNSNVWQYLHKHIPVPAG